MTNRNIAIYGNRSLNTSADNYLYALDAETGRLAWETQILDYLVNLARHSSGLIVAGGKAISSRSCRPHGGPEACVITAHDAETGAEVWRRRLVPAPGEPGEPGDETWGGVPFEERVHVGSWMAPSYDPELNLVYVGTSVTLEDSAGSDPATGVTKERRLRRETAGFVGVAPGITRGAIPVWLLLPGSAIGSARRRSPMRRRSGHM